MKTINWYFDFISPFGYFQLIDLKEKNIPNLKIKPILFAGLLNHWGHKGPAEIPSKRVHTYRLVTWLAKKQGIKFCFPNRHPFNPIPVLRLAIATGSNFEAIETIYDFIWGEGKDVSDPDNFISLCKKLNMSADIIQDPKVKKELIQNGEDAIKEGVFGVPTLTIDQEIFWGHDATGFALDYLKDPSLLEHEEMKRLSNIEMQASRV